MMMEIEEIIDETLPDEVPSIEGEEKQILEEIQIDVHNIYENIFETTAEETEIEFDEFYENYIEMYQPSEAEVSAISRSPVLAAAPAADLDGNFNLYTLRISGQDYQVLFPADADLVLVGDSLVNMGSSNVTGVILVNGSLSLDDYNEYYYTLYPVTSTSANTSLYRYNASGYLTRYSVRDANNLTSTVTYVNATVVDKPKVGFQLTEFQLILLFLILVQIFISFINGVIRRV